MNIALDESAMRTRMACPWTEMVKGFLGVSELEIIGFARIIDDSNPIHADVEAARKAGLEGIIAPGVMIIGFISRTLSEFLPGCQFKSVEKFRFQKPLYARRPFTITCVHEWSKRGFAKLKITVESRGTLLAEGVCTVLLPE